MAIRVKRRPRPVSEASPQPPRSKSDLSISIEASHARQIRELPKEQLKAVIDAITEGVKPDGIAMFFAEQGWLTVTEKSFKQYLAAFKRVYPELLKGGSADDLNGLVDPRKPRLDEVAHLEQLIRVQSRRLRVGVDFEERTKMTLNHLHKDVKTQGELIEKLSIIRNGGKQVGRPSQDQAGSNSADVSEALRKVDGVETKQDKIAGLMGSIVQLMDRKKKVETLSAKKKS